MNQMDFDKATILVVDDNPTNLKVLCGAIANSGWEILVATDGESAIEQTEYAQPDLILLDIMMPGIDGFETCQRLKANPDTQDIPILFMTALSDTVDKVKGLSLGAVDYITKPFQTEEVLARVNVHLKLRYLSKKLEMQNVELEKIVEERTEQLSQTLDNLKQSQIQLVQTEKMSSLGQLVAGIAHEMNNPLGYLIGNADLLNEYIYDLIEHLQLYRQHYSNPVLDIVKHDKEINTSQIIKDTKEVMSSMRTGIDSICKISNNLRTFSRPDNSHQEYLDIHECIDSTLMILKHRMKANRKRSYIEIIRKYGSLPYIACYPGQINQVFLNIISNAIEAFEQSGEQSKLMLDSQEKNTITITTGLNDSVTCVSISIEDNGPGISPKNKDKIFEQFFTTKTLGQASGLGLSISKQVIEYMHEGKLICNSEVGKGTEFIIEIPIR
ncbi:MAG: hybrid sensor histidine kinase/response regulator [Nostocaceae cyanobacterium]|nr:hybrid sensor histidine kinase/response regulator [Nostocaceae cyanobacterium]